MFEKFQSFLPLSFYRGSCPRFDFNKGGRYLGITEMLALGPFLTASSEAVAVLQVAVLGLLLKDFLSPCSRKSLYNDNTMQ